MKARAATLLIFAVALLLQRLPLEPVLWGEPPACCALAEYCPMSARPAEGTRAASHCEMTSDPSCSIQATCPTGRHQSDGALSLTALARPAVLDELAWAPALAPLSRLTALDSSLVSPPGESPPTPPPRASFV